MGIFPAIFADPLIFADAVRPLIRRDPVRCNVLATQLEGAVRRGTPPGSLWMVVRSGGAAPGAEAGPGRGGGAGADVVLAAMLTPPFGLWLTPVRDARPDDPADPVAERVALALARELLRRPGGPGTALPGVGGVVSSATPFARVWRELTGRRPRVTMRTRMFELSELAEPVGVPGTARPAGPADLDLCVDWLVAFHAEAAPDQPGGGELRARTQDRIALGHLTLWQDGGRPVSLAGTSTVVAGVARIGPVYTPPEQRGHGYGAAVTAAATRAGFGAGARRCMLFTDLANPTSNALYPRLGYRPVGDALTYAFLP
jgi:GNAT superfamily N-acetyltransferase